jgi:hypothetical protein
MDVWNRQKIKDGMYGLDLPLRTSIKLQDRPIKYTTLIFPQGQKPDTLEN